MATKNCPHCNKQVPVACKKCQCGHVFFTTRRSANSVSRETTESAATISADISEQVEMGDLLQPTRRSGRVTRERPNFYDALEYENQTRRERPPQSSDNEQSGSEVTVVSKRNQMVNPEKVFKKIFITVGTTRFDELIKLIMEERTLRQFRQWKTHSVRIQKGNSLTNEMVGRFTKEVIDFEIYDFKPFLTEDMKWADLVICHAGAGTTMEALDLGKPVVVVPNRALMDDHQLELASKLESEQNAVLSSISTFHEDMKTVQRSWFKPIRPKQTDKLAVFIDTHLLGLRR